MAEICKDPRHDSLMTLGNNLDEPERVFPHWNTESVSPEQILEHIRGQRLPGLAK